LNDVRTLVAKVSKIFLANPTKKLNLVSSRDSFFVVAISQDSGTYFIKNRVLSKEQIAAPREKRPGFAMTIEPKTGSIQQFAKTANCGHDTEL
jgi:hypothetical protein